MTTQSPTLGGLSCRVIDALPEGRDPTLVAVLCHGFGAPGTDLVPLAAELFALDPNLRDRVRFVFPAGPLTLDAVGLPGGRAWWHLDIERITAAIARGELRNLRDDLPDGLPESRKMLTSLIDELSRQSRLPASRMLLGGFSQGSMLATDVALRLTDRPAGLCIFSGTLLCESEWRELASRRGPMPVLQSHGMQDPLLPFQAAEWLRDLLIEAGMEVEFLPFAGMHTIPYEVLERMAVLLDRLTRSTAL